MVEGGGWRWTRTAEEGEDDSGNGGTLPIDFLSLAGLCGTMG